MAEHTIDNQTIALAAAFQALEQVQELAWHGQHSEQMLQRSVESILCTHPKTVDDVFGGRHTLSRGFKVLQQQLSGDISGKKMDITRHMSALVNLTHTIAQNDELLNQLGNALSPIQSRYLASDPFDDETDEWEDEDYENEDADDEMGESDDDSEHPNKAHRLRNAVIDLANVYQNNISPLGKKVIIQGKQAHLTDEHTARLIRVFLLSAVRALILWQQCGGGRFKLIWNRNKHIQAAKQLTEWKH